MRNFVLASESVTAGHPDKLCDQISDAVVDACLCSAPKVGCVAECAIATGVIFLSIRHGRPLDFDPAALARRVLAELGGGAATRSARTTVMLDSVEMPELVGPVPAETMRVNRMTTAFGFACNQTETLMPWPIWAAHAISSRLGALSRDERFGWLSADSQVQIGVRFEDRRPVAVTGIAISYFAPDAPPQEDIVREMLTAEAIVPALAGSRISPDKETRIVFRQSPGDGGPGSHAGLTGRKTNDDGYGGYCRQSGSALSGKDPSRIDRVAAYAARQAAVSAVAAGLATECEVQLSFVPGDQGPASFEVDTFGSGTIPEREINALLNKALDMRIGAIIERLRLWDLPLERNGRFYRDLASPGHFGRLELNLPWDQPVRLA